MNETWWVDPSQLDDDQKQVVALPPDRDHLITGPPGSGKTNLLLLKATEIVRMGKPNVLILVFTRTLREFVASGVSHYAFGPEKIKTFAGWTSQFLREEGVEPETDADFETQRKKQVRQLTDVVSRRKHGQLWDAMFIDEGQDCLPEEIELFRSLAKVLIVAADDRQRIYSTGDSVAEWKKKIANVFPLRFHYRNGEKICALADAISKTSDPALKLVPTCQYKESERPSSVDAIFLPTIADQVGRAAKTLEDQMKAYPDEMLGLICPRHSELNQVIEELKRLPIASSCVFQTHGGGGYVPFEREKPICVCTIHSAKGLEFRTLHIVGTDLLKKFQHQRRLAYTAVTRAKTSLSLYHGADMPPFLGSAVASLSKPPARPKLDDLFRGGPHNVA